MVNSAGVTTGFIGVDYDISLIRQELAAIDQFASLAIVRLRSWLC